MIELTGIGTVLRDISILYWLLAIGALALVAWKVKRWSYKAISIAVVVGIFSYLPAQAWQEAQMRESDSQKREAYAREAWAYFKKLCDEKSGEKIYKTYTGVKSVLVVKPLPPATEKDLYDQFWYGDPYSTESALVDRGVRLARTVVGQQKFRDGNGDIGLDFFEIKHIDSAKQYERVEPLNDHPYQRTTEIEKPSSRFGITWEDISTTQDRKYWVAGSRLRVIDLADNSVVAERIGYLIEAGFGSPAGQRRPWQTSRGPNTTCPSITNGTFEDRWFILKVLRPTEGDKNGK